jgi:hypothetical protein
MNNKATLCLWYEGDAEASGAVSLVEENHYE